MISVRIEAPGLSLKRKKKGGGKEKCSVHKPKLPAQHTLMPLYRTKLCTFLSYCACRFDCDTSRNEKMSVTTTWPILSLCNTQHDGDEWHETFFFSWVGGGRRGLGRQEGKPGRWHPTYLLTTHPRKTWPQHRISNAMKEWGKNKTKI